MTDETEKTELDKATELLDSLPDDGVQVYKFAKPVTVCGKTFTELTLDFESLTGADMEAIESAIVAEGLPIPQVREFSKIYQMHVTAKAAKININELRAFPINHVTKLTMLAQGFLMSAD